ncbi:hypothetical protein RFI_16922 [Reticulomyxa filosa]|uniref:Uncharacterized protein n=1 Tax=Reticulomyxa filosa TaxID=46433 RepID=X6N1Z6_RETFI|nr:hypothetical protein RFI_16922 [Reticulomyxa filosa]|eukprot:ETO20295.1 hypothetical protein RFI_16922 [Reticulomyxa filosa]
MTTNNSAPKMQRSVSMRSSGKELELIAQFHHFLDEAAENLNPRLSRHHTDGILLRKRESEKPPLQLTAVLSNQSSHGDSVMSNESVRPVLSPVSNESSVVASGRPRGYGFLEKKTKTETYSRNVPSFREHEETYMRVWQSVQKRAKFLMYFYNEVFGKELTFAFVFVLFCFALLCFDLLVLEGNKLSFFQFCNFLSLHTLDDGNFPIRLEGLKKLERRKLEGIAGIGSGGELMLSDGHLTMKNIERTDSGYVNVSTGEPAYVDEYRQLYRKHFFFFFFIFRFLYVYLFSPFLIPFFYLRFFYFIDINVNILPRFPIFIHFQSGRYWFGEAKL